MSADEEELLDRIWRLINSGQAMADRLVFQLERTKRERLQEGLAPDLYDLALLNRLPARPVHSFGVE